MKGGSAGQKMKRLEFVALMSKLQQRQSIL